MKTIRIVGIKVASWNDANEIIELTDSIRKGKVPDVLIGTIEPPAGMAITGHGCLIQARLCRPKRDESRGDQQAKEVSDGLPFLEYELHRQLIHKLRIKGMNAIFGLKVCRYQCHIYPYYQF